MSYICGKSKIIFKTIIFLSFSYSVIFVLKSHFKLLIRKKVWLINRKKFQVLNDLCHVFYTNNLKNYKTDG